MGRELKVWSGWTFDSRASHRGQVRFAIATPTKKAAIEALRTTASHFNNYCGDTESVAEVEIAMTRPGILFVRPLDSRDPAEWEAIEPKETPHA